MAETAKRRLGKRTYGGGLESSLDTAAVVLLWLGIIAAVILVVLQPQAFIVSLATLGQGILAWLLFRSLAEIIRLLKRQADLPYGGRISGAKEVIAWECSHCGAPLSGHRRCDRCGRMIVGKEGDESSMLDEESVE